MRRAKKTAVEKKTGKKVKTPYCRLLEIPVQQFFIFLNQSGVENVNDKNKKQKKNTTTRKPRDVKYNSLLNLGAVHYICIHKRRPGYRVKHLPR